MVVKMLVFYVLNIKVLGFFRKYVICSINVNFYGPCVLFYPCFCVKKCYFFPLLK